MKPLEEFIDWLAPFVIWLTKIVKVVSIVFIAFFALYFLNYLGNNLVSVLKLHPWVMFILDGAFLFLFLRYIYSVRNLGKEKLSTFALLLLFVLIEIYISIRIPINLIFCGLVVILGYLISYKIKQGYYSQKQADELSPVFLYFSMHSKS